MVGQKDTTEADIKKKWSNDHFTPLIDNSHTHIVDKSHAKFTAGLEAYVSLLRHEIMIAYVIFKIRTDRKSVS